MLQQITSRSLEINTMCGGDYVFGGDLDNPKVGYNRYKLWTRSKSYEGLYCIVLLISVIIALVIFFNKNSLDNCYESALVWVILAHIIKPFVIAISIKFIPKKPICCAVLRLSPMIFMDLPYAIFVMIFSWYPLLICILDNDNIEIDGLILFILLSCLIIHLLFPLMAIVRLMEVIVFEKRLKEFRKQRREQQRQQQREREEEEEEEQDEDNDNDTEITEIEEEEQDEDNFINNDNEESKDQFSEDLDNTFIYGTISSKKGNDNDHKTSLSNIFAASTRFISSGLVNINDEEEICIVCYDVFEKGKLCARLTCGHVLHRNCAKEWFNESPTCPLCRIGVTKQ